MAALSQHRQISGEGTPEFVWQPWLYSFSISRLTLSQWLPLSARLVVVAPHPDDEILACGGLISMHRTHGGEVAVIAVTDGEASHGSGQIFELKAMAKTRRAEGITGLQQIGLDPRAITHLGLPDGAVSKYTMQLTLKLQQLIRPGDCVLTTWGLDGHPDHEATALSAFRACSIIGCRLVEAPVWMWHWAAPADPFVPWHRLRRLELSQSAQQRKQAGLHAHLSQLNADGRAGGAVLGEAIVARAHRVEEYFFI